MCIDAHAGRPGVACAFVSHAPQMRRMVSLPRPYPAVMTDGQAPAVAAEGRCGLGARASGATAVAAAQCGAWGRPALKGGTACRGPWGGPRVKFMNYNEKRK